MTNRLYNPFDRYTFTDRACFLSGERTEEKTAVFPDWLMEKFQLAQQPFKLLDEQIVTYQDIAVPCSDHTKKAAESLETEISDAFGQGYEAVRKLDEQKLFQWIAKLVYGMIHYEIGTGIKKQRAMGEDINFSQSLVHKFTNLQFMLQSLIRPTVFEGVPPWTILVFPVDNAPATFSYRDEINTLSFSLKMADFGIIACLQDNGANKKYHAETLKEVEGQKLHPLQFEELCGKFFYSAYLFNRLPEYTFLPTEEAVYIESMEFFSIHEKSFFDVWQNKTYGQVLENFWKPWGFSLFEIIKDPDNPMTYLLDEEGRFRDPQTITL